MDTYIPGICNIGRSEKQKRLRAAILAFIFTVFIQLGFFYFPQYKYWNFLIFFPILVGCVSFIQYTSKFCVKLAVLGKYNMSNIENSVTDKQAYQEDFWLAMGIISKSLISAAILTILIVHLA